MMTPQQDLREVNFEEGYIAVIDKPLRWTSTDVVRKVKFALRRAGYRKIKVGHAGTLDPLATGVLLVCIGRATKMVDALQAEEKEYVADVMLGAPTPSYAGEELALRQALIRIYELQLEEYDLPRIRIRVRCSKGTYIRSLAREIGEELHSGAHLTSLRRTRSGGFTTDGAWQLEDFLKKLSEIETKTAFPRIEKY